MSGGPPRSDTEAEKQRRQTALNEILAVNNDLESHARHFMKAGPTPDVELLEAIIICSRQAASTARMCGEVMGETYGDFHIPGRDKQYGIAAEAAKYVGALAEDTEHMFTEVRHILYVEGEDWPKEKREWRDGSCRQYRDAWSAIAKSSFTTRRSAKDFIEAFKKMNVYFLWFWAPTGAGFRSPYTNGVSGEE